MTEIFIIRVAEFETQREFVISKMKLKMKSFVNEETNMFWTVGLRHKFDERKEKSACVRVGYVCVCVCNRD